MPDAVTEPITPTDPPADPPADPKPESKPRKLEDLLASLDDDARNAVLGEVGKARNEAKGLRDRVKALEPKAAEYEKLEAAAKTELERAEERAKAAEDKVQGVTRRAVTAEVKALAATDFADPSDAAAFLDLARYATGEDIDTDAIATDLADLLTRKPHLRRGDGRRAPAPDPSQGSSARGAVSLDAQIAAAEKAGDVRATIRLKTAQGLAAGQPQTLLK